MSLLQKYRDAFRDAWAGRDRLAPEKRRRSELEFLPAALELIETPPSPVARRLLWGGMGFLSLALLWSIFGEVDIVAVAQGKVVPAGQVRVLQSFERAVVRRLLVRDGMQVRQGQLLIELDAGELAAEQGKVGSSLHDAMLAAARARALLAAAQRGAEQAQPVAADAAIPAASLEAANRLLASEYAAFHSELQLRAAETLHLQAQRATTRESLDKLVALYPLYEQRSADLRRLLEKNYVPRHEFLEQENRRTETAREIEVQRKRLLEMDALLAQQQQQQAAAVAGFIRQTRAQLVAAEQQVAQLQQEGTRLRGRGELLALRAPVDGTVQQLAVHTEGGVVTEAQMLLVIVPANERLEIEAMIENRDIGFIERGQAAAVKVEAFPFTRFGSLEGRVGNVSLDAVVDERRGLLYQARVALDRSWLDVAGRKVALLPGMAVAVEIKTGRRRIIDYFLSPVLQYGSESIRER